MRHFDLCVIGSGPSGQRAAIQAAKLGKTAVIIESRPSVGGVAINTGTIPSKALREAVLALGRGPTGAPRPQDFAVANATVEGLRTSCRRVIDAEVALVEKHLASNGITLLRGTGRFRDEHTVEVVGEHSAESVHADFIAVAVGTSPARPDSIPFDTSEVITSDELLTLASLPRSMIVVGGGVIGTEYASILSALGVKVTLVDGRARLLDFVDTEIVEALQYHLRKTGVTLRLGEKVVSIRRVEAPSGSRSSDGYFAEALLESGKTLRADCLCYCIGRQGSTSALNLAGAGLEADDRGRIRVDSAYRTRVPHIFAVGDVVGFPALASTSMEQGRIAACAMFHAQTEAYEPLFPYGIYSIPEISMVGWTEERLTAEGIPYESGVAQYQELARGQLLGDETGMLKLLLHQESHAVLGVHIIGTNATELVHIGQMAIAHKATVEEIVNTVFNYPTLAEAYKVAAFNGLNRLKCV